MDNYINNMPFVMIHLCIDEVDNYQIKGTAYNNTVEEPIVFQDIHDMILKVDKIFDKNGNPQSSRMKRSFQKEEKESSYQVNPKTYCEYTDYLDKKGKINTFDILVQSRRHSTWQGSLFYQEQEEKFENILELLKKLATFLSL